jgi:hypothetical protein
MVPTATKENKMTPEAMKSCEEVLTKAAEYIAFVAKHEDAELAGAYAHCEEILKEAAARCRPVPPAAPPKPSFAEALEAAMKKMQELVDNRPYGKSQPEVLGMEMGRRYVRVTRQSVGSSGKSAYCFIDITNGDVLKAESYKKPAKHARGNIYSGKLGVTCYGGEYLR